MAPSTGWTRSPRTQTAVRGLGKGAIVLLRRDHLWFICGADGSQMALNAGAGLNLEDAVQWVDTTFPPEGWTVVSEDKWTRDGWACVRGADGWYIEHPRGAMRQRFSTCDRARKWVDLRVDRPGGIRGPRLRTDAPALCTFPDVRVTQEEREKAMKLAKSLGLTFADFLRSAVQLVDDLNAAGTFDTDATARGKKLIPLSPARNVRATYEE
jgi:hypothetical protein